LFQEGKVEVLGGDLKGGKRREGRGGEVEGKEMC
jgi:hypothetical protein